jgi:hypothetical protein
LLHTHVPTVLAAQRVQHRVLHDGESVFALEGPLEFAFDLAVERGKGASTASSAIPTATSSGW